MITNRAREQRELLMARLGEGIGLLTSGDRAAAGDAFAEVWRATNDPIVLCGAAHSMADVQVEPIRELLWDLRALAYARNCDDPADLLPSLHLNLADVYCRLGAVDRAGRHVSAGQAALQEVAPNGYFDMIAGGLARIMASLPDRSS